MKAALFAFFVLTGIVWAGEKASTFLYTAKLAGYALFATFWFLAPRPFMDWFLD